MWHAASRARRSAGFARAGRVLALGLIPLVVLAGLAAAVVYVKLLHGPISLEFLAEPLERGIGSELPGLTVRVGDAELGLGDTGKFEVRLRKLEIAEPDGDIVASMPLAAVELSGRALWRLRLVPVRVDLIEPRIAAEYTSDGRLKLSLSREPSPGGDETDIAVVELKSGPARARPSTRTEADERQPSRRIELARLLSEASASARERSGAGSYLREVGLRNATITLEMGGRASIWTVPRASIDLKHGRKNSTIAGDVRFQSPQGPWTLAFQVEDSERTKTLTVKTSVAGLVPSGLAANLPRFGVLGTIDVPITGDATTSLSSDGEILSAAVSIRAGPGAVRLPSIDPTAAFSLDGGEFTLTYDGGTRKAILAPAFLAWGESRIALQGEFVQAVSGTDPAWTFDIAATDGQLTAEEFQADGLTIETWRAQGRLVPGREMIELSRFDMRAGDGAVSMSGAVSTRTGDDSMRLEGTLSPMSVATARILWPRFLAPGARLWVGEHVAGGRTGASQFRYVSGSHLDTGRRGGSGLQDYTMTVEALDIAVRPAAGLPPVEIPKAMISVSPGGVALDMPEAAILLEGGTRVPIEGGRFTARDLAAPAPVGELAFRSKAPLAQVVRLLEQASVTPAANMPIEGAAEGDFSIRFPLLAELDLSDVGIEGSATVQDGRAKGIAGSLDIAGAAVAFAFTAKAIEAKGKMLVNGVPADLNWQYIHDAPPDRQPPLRVTATLGNSDRSSLGLDINHIVQGDVPVEVVAARGGDGKPAVRLRADLTEAELFFEAIAWKKPPGRAAILECDILQQESGATELENLRISGDNIAIEGGVSLGKDHRLRKFHLPRFVLDVVTRLDVSGSLRADNVLLVKARGDSFDGRNFFRALFSVGRISDRELRPERPRAGMDLDVEIDSVIGFSEVSLRRLKLKASKRDDKLTVLDGQGTLDGGSELSFALKQEKGQPRKLLANSADAGQAFRLVGFYPSLQGGRVRLDVNADGKGPAEKTGDLLVEDFRILGDRIASEVLASADQLSTAGGAPGGSKPAKAQERQIWYFQRMRAAFSVGHGQFVLEEASLQGPLLQANLRGKVDYNSKAVSLGGTYAPLGVRAFAGIPIVDPLLNGPRGEGILAMTFAIEGPLDSPQVIMNPFALIAPGIFREFFQMTNPNPRVLAPRIEKPAAAPPDAVPAVKKN